MLASLLAMHACVAPGTPSVGEELATHLVVQCTFAVALFTSRLVPPPTQPQPLSPAPSSPVPAVVPLLDASLVAALRARLDAKLRAALPYVCEFVRTGALPSIATPLLAAALRFYHIPTGPELMSLKSASQSSGAGGALALRAACRSVRFDVLAMLLSNGLVL